MVKNLSVIQETRVWFLGGERNDNTLQYSCLGNPMDRGAWRATVHTVTREADTTEWLSMHLGGDTGDAGPTSPRNMGTAFMSTCYGTWSTWTTGLSLKRSEFQRASWSDILWPLCQCCAKSLHPCKINMGEILLLEPINFCFRWATKGVHSFSLKSKLVCHFHLSKSSRTDRLINGHWEAKISPQIPDTSVQASK